MSQWTAQVECTVVKSVTVEAVSREQAVAKIEALDWVDAHEADMSDWEIRESTLTEAPA